MNTSSFATDVLGINRYIVGCKFDNIKNYLDKAGGINRYIVGCKLYFKLLQTYV